MYGRGYQPQRPPPINYGFVQDPQGAAWDQNGWQQSHLPPSLHAPPPAGLVPFHGGPGISLQPLPMHQGWGPSPLSQRPHARPPPQHYQEQWHGQGPPPSHGSPPFAGRGPGGRMNGSLQGQGRRGGRGRGQSPGQPHPGRGGGAGGPALQNGAAHPAVVPAVKSQVGNGAGVQVDAGLTGKAAKKMRKALQQLAEEEAAPKRVRTLTPAEVAEGAKWQEERRRHFPSEANLAKRAEEARARAERGELDTEGQQKRRSLHDVLRLQRELGLAKAAGTETMQVEGGDGGIHWQGGRGRGRGRGRGGRGRGGRGRGRHYVEYHQAPPEGDDAVLEPVAEPQAPGVVPESAAPEPEGRESAAGLLGLGGYESEGDGGPDAMQEDTANQPGVQKAAGGDETPMGKAQAAPTNGSKTLPESPGDGPAAQEADKAGLTTTRGTPAEVAAKGTEGGPAAQEAKTPGTTTTASEGPGGVSPAAQEAGKAGSTTATGTAAEVAATTTTAARGPGVAPEACKPPGHGGGGMGNGAAAPKRKRNPGKGKNGAHAQHTLPPRREPLLQKLLAREIRQEHSHLLQCFRFLVNNNFLQDVDTHALVFPTTQAAQTDYREGLREALKDGGTEGASEGEDSGHGE